MHDNRHARSPVIITIALHGTLIVHIFTRVCALIYNGVSLSTPARHLGRQYLLATAEVIPHLLLDVVATKQRRAAWPRLPRPREWNKRVDQRQTPSAMGARTGMRDQRDSRPVARTWPGSPVLGDSCRDVRCKSIPWLSHVALDIRMEPLLAGGAGQHGARVQ